MNLNIIKDQIESKLNCMVEIKVYGTRNKTEVLVGQIISVYPNIFTVIADGENKSFRYADIINGEIKVKYL